MEEIVSEKLIGKIKKITELENNIIKIKIAQYLRKVEEKIKFSEEEIGLRVDEDIEYYGQRIKNYEEYKNNMISNYRKEFENISNEFETKIINIIIQTKNIEFNQKVAMLKCNKLKNSREDFLKSKEYEEYKKLKIKYKEDLDNALTKLEFDKNLELLDNLTDPIQEYNEQIEESLNEAIKYDEIIQECYQEIEITQNELVEQLNNIINNKTKQLSIYKNTNIFSKIINKFSNIFNGKKKLQNLVINNFEQEISDVEEVVVAINETTKNKTIDFIQKILDMKQRLIVKNENLTEEEI